MKILNTIPAFVLISLVTLSQAMASQSQIWHANLNPQNTSAHLLLATLTSLKIQEREVKITPLGRSHLKLEVERQGNGSQEGAIITAEILIRQNELYVFNYSVERSVAMQTFSGASRGNR